MDKEKKVVVIVYTTYTILLIIGLVFAIFIPILRYEEPSNIDLYCVSLKGFYNTELSDNIFECGDIGKGAVNITCEKGICSDILISGNKFTAPVELYISGDEVTITNQDFKAHTKNYVG